EALHRDPLQQGRERRTPDPRWVRLHGGVRDLAPLPRPEDPRDRRRHERGATHGHREAPWAVTMPLVHLTTVGSGLEAEMLCGELRANGIECMHQATGIVANQFGSAIASATFGAGVPTAVLVDERDLDRARQLLPRG